MRRVAAAILTSALLAACGGDAARSTTSPPLPVEGELADGTHFGFVAVLDPARFRLVFDRAELLDGAEARAAAGQDGGVVTQGGFYVRDLEDRMHRVTLDPDIRVRLLRPCCELTEVTFESWLDGFLPEDRTFFGTADSHYEITVEGGRVVAVDEVHVP